MSVDALAFKKTLFLEQLCHQLILDAEAHGFLLSFLKTSSCKRAYSSAILLGESKAFLPYLDFFCFFFFTECTMCLYIFCEKCSLLVVKKKKKASHVAVVMVVQT